MIPLSLPSSPSGVKADASFDPHFVLVARRPGQNDKTLLPNTTRARLTEVAEEVAVRRGDEGRRAAGQRVLVGLHRAIE